MPSLAPDGGCAFAVDLGARRDSRAVKEFRRAAGVPSDGDRRYRLSRVMWAYLPLFTIGLLGDSYVEPSEPCSNIRTRRTDIQPELVN